MVKGGSLTQVALVVALCCAGHVCMVGGGGCSCMLLQHPVLTSADAALTFAPCVLTFAPCTCGASLRNLH